MALPAGPRYGHAVGGQGNTSMRAGNGDQRERTPRGRKPEARKTAARKTMATAKSSRHATQDGGPDSRAPEDAPARSARGIAPQPAAPMRIAKYLARAGVASRRGAEALVAEGRVSVDGAAVATPGLTVRGTERIAVDGQPVAAPAPPRLWLYHKPAGLVTTARDEKGRPTVFDRLPPDLPRVMSVGRLDLNSEGLLLLTNDGALKRRLELPSTGWLRRYRVRVRGTPDEAMLDPLRKGITVDGEAFRPMAVTLDRQQGGNAWLTLGLREGRNREVRRAMEAVGLMVNRLIRIAYGPFRLGDLAPGAVEELRPAILRDQIGPGFFTEEPGAQPGGAPPSSRERRRSPAPGKSAAPWAPPGAGKPETGPAGKVRPHLPGPGRGKGKGKGPGISADQATTKPARPARGRPGPVTSRRGPDKSGRGGSSR